ncbi:hypothetical protein ABI59_08190 [Acidobacteria bacterium Mor1]|nr:hypothetical protein ABI59_08190 [Acidobacteria bacterium Mor1]
MANREQIDRIYAESHALWGGGLKPAEYREFWSELASTPWAERNVRYFVWLGDEGELLSSLKLYHPRIVIDGTAGRASIVGAVFTPRKHRRAGHARELISAVLDHSRDEGDVVALLFSDIGTRYYADFGFRSLPSTEVWGRLTGSPPGPGNWSSDEMRAEHLPDVRAAHEAWCARQPLAIERSAEHWQFLFVRTAGFFRRLGDRRLRHRATVVLEDGRFVGYLIAVEGHGEWSVREVGAVGGDPGKIEGVLRHGAAIARAEGLRKFYGWIEDPVIERMGGWTLRRTTRRRAQPMILGLDEKLDVEPLLAGGRVFFPYQDQF